MVRRDFLKLSGMLSAALVLQVHPFGKAIALPAEVEAQGMIYRGTTAGKIFISADSGKSWQLHTNFGAEVSIAGLITDSWGQMRAQLGFESHSFELALAQNGKTWMTV